MAAVAVARGRSEGRTDGPTDGRIIVLHVYCASVAAAAAAAVIDRRGRGQGGGAKKNATYDDIHGLESGTNTPMRSHTRHPRQLHEYRRL